MIAGFLTKFSCSTFMILQGLFQIPTGLFHDSFVICRHIITTVPVYGNMYVMQVLYHRIIFRMLGF